MSSQATAAANAQRTPSLIDRLGALEERLVAHLKTTPGMLRAALGINIIAIVLLALTAWHCYTGLSHTVQIVGKDTVPSIVAAEHIRSKLSNANSDAMTAILNHEGEDSGYMKRYRKNMNEVHEELLAASRNITFGDEERVPILEVMQKLSVYEELIGKARLKAASGDITPVLAANELMRTKLLTAAGELDLANFKHLDDTIVTHKTHLFATMAPFLVGMVLVLAALAGGQLLLYRKTKRLINPGFAVASLLVVLFTLHSVYSLKQTESALTAAKYEAFDSIHALWMAKSIIADANADQTLYMVYHGHSDAQASAGYAFSGKVRKLINNDKQGKKAYGGVLGDAMSNVSFPGEQAAAEAVVRDFSDYLKLDKKMRELEQAGRYQEALALNAGTKENECNWAFERLNGAIDKAIEINQTEFDQRMIAAAAFTKSFPYTLGALVVLVIAACVIGMKPRIDEYRF